MIWMEPRQVEGQSWEKDVLLAYCSVSVHKIMKAWLVELSVCSWFTCLPSVWEEERTGISVFLKNHMGSAIWGLLT